MKQILKYIAIPFLALLSVACQERYVTYSDAEYVMFADTLATYPVQQDVEYFSIPVVSTVTRDYDRTFGVEITIPNSKERLRPGMYARATFNMGSRQGVLVDDVAVQKLPRMVCFHSTTLAQTRISCLQLLIRLQMLL